MQTVIIVVHLMIVLALVVVVLLQRSEGGGLGIGGGGGFMSGRAQANALTRATAILAGLFFVTSIALAWLGSSGHANRSIFDIAAPTAPAGTNKPAVPTSGGVLQMLKPKSPGQSPPVSQNPATPVPAAPRAPTEPEVPTSR
jgi:preprotein translocase subunit SecG